MTIRTLCVAALLAFAPLAAQTIQLSDGQVLLASIEQVDGQGLRVRRLDNGGVLDLRWEHLSADSAQRIKAANDLGGDTEDEVMVKADLVKYRINDIPTEVIGRIVDRTPTHIIVMKKGQAFPVPKDAGLLIQTVEVPATQVFTRDEYYTKRLSEVQPTTADKHMQFAQELIKVKDYDHAREHLDLAQKANDSKDPSQLQNLMRKLELYRENEKEKGMVDAIQTSRARSEFDKGLKQIEDYKKLYPQGGKLKADFDREVTRFTEARKQFLSAKVADQWRRIIRSTAERKVGEAGITWAAAKEYATSKMSEDISGRVAAMLQLTPEETRQMWQERARWPAGKRSELFSYGIGSWTLTEKAILKDTKLGKESQKPPKDAQQEREIEQIQKLIAAAKARMKQDATAQKEATEEDWWRGATANEKAGWLRAYYAEFSGDLVLVAAFLQDCPTCAGEGSVPEVVDGKVMKQPCFLCHRTKYLRSFTAY